MKLGSSRVVYFLTIVGVFALLFVWDAGQRVLASWEVLDQTARVDQSLQAAEAKNKQLVQLKAAVQTDTWVEKFVRTVWHWSKPDETVILPRTESVTPSVVAPASTPEPTPASPNSTSTAASSKSFWDDLLDWLFGPAQ